jgi:hypothetical protein
MLEPVLDVKQHALKSTTVGLLSVLDRRDLHQLYDAMPPKNYRCWYFVHFQMGGLDCFVIFQISTWQRLIALLETIRIHAV